jgi:hypothetical protein
MGEYISGTTNQGKEIGQNVFYSEEIEIDNSTIIQNGAGQIEVNPSLTLPNITISNTTTLNNVSASGTLSVTGNSTLSTLDVTNISASGTLSVTGNSTLSTLDVTNISASGTLSVTGNSTLSNIILSGIIEINDTLGSLSGTTAGSISWSMPFQGSAYKKFIAYLNGYENDTTTAQTISFPVAFSDTPVIVVNSASVPSVTVSTTEISLAPDTTTAYTGWIIVEGF